MTGKSYLRSLSPPTNHLALLACRHSTLPRPTEVPTGRQLVEMTMTSVFEHGHALDMHAIQFERRERESEPVGILYTQATGPLELTADIRGSHNLIMP